MGIYVIAFLVSTLIGLFVIERMMGIFYGKRRTTLFVMLLSYLFVFIMFSFEHLFFLRHPVYIRIAVEIPIALTGYFLLTLNYKSSIVKRFVVSATIYLLFLGISTLAGVMLYLIIPFYSLYYEEEVLNFIMLLHIAILPLAYLVTTILRRFKNIRKNEAFFPVAFVVPVLVTLVLLYPLWSAFAYLLDLDIPGEINIILLGVFMMGATFLIFYLYDTLSAAYKDKLQAALSIQEKEYYFAQCQLMQESVEQMKAFRHDVKSQLTTLKDYTIKGKVGDTTAYLDNLLKDVEKSETYCNTSNIAFDSIINYKLRNAKNDNIKPDLKISIPPNLNVEVVDIVAIFGNLLDNALEAVAKVEEKIIKLDIAYDKGGLFAKVENSFNGEIKYSDGKGEEEKQIVSLKGNNEHGYGLKNIKKSIEKYDGYMKITNTENIFSVGVFLYVDEV